MPTPDLVVVDGPNLYNRVGELLEHLVDAQPGASADVGAYLSDWFDFDRLLAVAVGATEWPPERGIILVHSDRALGRGVYRIDRPRPFWSRQARASACRDVLVPVSREDVENVQFACSSCGHLHQEKVKGEKGVDATVIATLYEHTHVWNTAVLAANDTDYAPVLDSLHRLGKTVLVVGRRTSEGSALELRGHDFFDLPLAWLQKDLQAFSAFRRDGRLDLVCRSLADHGFSYGLRFVSRHEQGPPFHNRHDLELIVEHMVDDRSTVVHLVEQGLQLPWANPTTRNDELLVVNFWAGRPVMAGVDRYARDAAWGLGTSHEFPSRLLKPRRGADTQA